MIDAKMLATYTIDVSVEVWGVWIPRRGDNVVVPMEVVANYGTYLLAEIYHKNYDETGNGAATGQSMVFDQSVERKTITLLGAKELIRVKLTLQRGGDLGEDEAGLVLFRFLQPAWFEAVKG